MADNSSRVGTVELRFEGDQGGVTGWTLAGASGVDRELDGLPTTFGDFPDGEMAEGPPAHPNGATAIDHVVIQSPDVERTVAALEEIGLAERRRRVATEHSSPLLQVFFRTGEVIVELIGSPSKVGDGPAEFFGLAFTVADLEALGAAGEPVGEMKPAIQPGRSRRSVRTADIGVSVPLLFLSPQAA